MIKKISTQCKKNPPRVRTDIRHTSLGRHGEHQPVTRATKADLRRELTVNGRGYNVTVVQAKRQGRNGERAVRVEALLSGQVADTAKIDLRTARAERARRASREGWRRGEGRGEVVDGGILAWLRVVV